MKKLLTYTIAIAALISCRTAIDIELPQTDSKLVLNSYQSTDSVWVFYLSASLMANSQDSLEFVKNGTITIKGDDGSSDEINGSQSTVKYQIGTYWDEFSQQLVTDTFGRRIYEQYIGTTTPKSGVTYSIEAKAPGYVTVSTEVTFPTPVPVNGVDTGTTLSEGWKAAKVDVRFTDPAGDSNYYDMKFHYVTYTPVYDSINQTFDLAENRARAYYYPIETSFFDFSAFQGFDDGTFDGQTIEKSYAGELYYLQNPYDSLIPAYFITELRTTTVDYYLYKRSVALFDQSKGSPFAQPVQIYTNIKNGYGVVAPYTAYLDTLDL